ncbi:uncharacterized protein LOC144051023 [Vanacampus margaritifer]
MLERLASSLREDSWGQFASTASEMCAISVKEEYEEELCGTKDENEGQSRLMDAGLNKFQNVLHRAGPCEKSLNPEQQKPESLHIKQEESEQLHIKEEPEHRYVKEEPEHHCVKVEEEPDHPHIKEEAEEYDVTRFHSIGEVKPLKSKGEHKAKSGENSGAEPPSSSSSHHMTTESDGDHCRGPQVNSLLAPPSDDDDVTSHSSDTDNLAPSSDDNNAMSHSSDTDSLTPSDDDGVTSHTSETDTDTDNDEPFCSDMTYNADDQSRECSHCGQSFVLLSLLKIHMRIHAREKCYTCSVCGKKFSSDDLDLRHRFHSENISPAILPVINMAAFNREILENQDDLSFSCIMLNMDRTSKKRYLEKLDQAGTRDPYALPGFLFLTLEHCEVGDLPNMCYEDILNYIIYATSMYTQEELREYKSLDAYKYFEDGHVRGTGVWEIPGKEIYLIVSKVMRSQLQNKLPLRVWVVVQKKGSVLSYHCTCMSDLSKHCSHAVATLFAVENRVRMAQEMNCPDVRQEQTQATSMTYSEMADVDTTANMRKITEEAEEDVTELDEVPFPTSPEKAAFYQSLSESVVSCAVLNVLPDVHKRFMPISVLKTLPPPLTSLYQSKYERISEEDLRKVADEVFRNMKITEEQVATVEKVTRKQSAWSTTLWYRQRAGRLTTSDFKALTRTSIERPSLSLINRICYPGSCVLSPDDTRWGCKHAKTAMKLYSSIQASSHQAFTTRDCGFVVWKENPHVGASPDSIVRCKCCGVGCVQIKCFHCLQQESLTAVDHDHSFYCCRDDWCEIPLKHDDAYYFRVQAQLRITNGNYCDFVVWRNDTISVQRIKFDVNFCIDTSRVNFAYCHIILPELLGKFYSRRVS